MERLSPVFAQAVRAWLVTSILAVVAAPSQAAPVTLELTRRLTEVCDSFPPMFGSCTPDRRVVEIHVTYDPDTLVLDTSRPGELRLRTDGPLVYDISLPAMTDPWGGVITRQSEASAEFAGVPLGTRRASGLQIIDTDLKTPGCTVDGKCDRGWLTSLEFGNFFGGNPIGVPGADDFAAMLRHNGGAGSWFLFMTVAWYTPLGGTERVFLPESRWYYAAAPEPVPVILMPLALGMLALRRWVRTHR